MARPDLSQRMARLGDATAADVRALWEAVLEARLMPGDFLDAAVGHIVRANSTGQALALQDFAEQMVRFYGEMPAGYAATLPLPHATDPARIGAGLHTITDRAVTAEAMKAATTQLIRYARSEVFEATQRQYAEEMKASPLVEGWVRGLEAAACELCHWWGREGRVWPASHTMPTHKGCHCRPIPTFVRERSLRGVSRGAQFASAERAAAGTYRERQQMDTADYSSRTTRR